MIFANLLAEDPGAIDRIVATVAGAVSSGRLPARLIEESNTLIRAAREDLGRTAAAGRISLEAPPAPSRGPPRRQAPPNGADSRTLRAFRPIRRRARAGLCYAHRRPGQAMEVVMARTVTALMGLLLLTGAIAASPPSASAEDEIGIVREKAGNLPHDEALKLLGETLGKSIEATQSDPTIPDILDALDANIAATRKLRELVDGDTPVTEEQMAEIAAEITTIARSFGAIAELAPGVFERRLTQLGNIDAIGQEVGFRIADAHARLEALRQNNAEIDAEVRAETLTPPEIEKRRLTRQANDAEMHSLEAAVAAWTYFSERHADVVTRLGDQSANLDVFFHALKENARVYDSAARTLNMANSLNLALSTLGSVEDLNSLRSDLVKSWTDLMKIVDEVNDGLMLQPGM